MKHLFGPLRHLNFWETAAFETNGGGGGGGGGGSSSSSTSRTEADVQADINAAHAASGGEWTSEMNDLVAERTAIRSGGGSTASTSSSSSSSSSSSNDKNTVGSVSQTGQYAGDGFEFVENEGGYLTRTYTGANEDAGLGQDVIAGGTSDKATKEAIANISLNEGSAFAGSAASATDGDLLNLLNPDIEGTGQSGSYAEQVGQVDYTPTITYGDDAPAVTEKSFGDTFAENRAAGNETFIYKGNLFTTELASDAPAPAPAAPTVSYDAFGNAYDTPEAAAQADQVAEAQAAVAQNAIAEETSRVFDPRGDQIQSSTSNGAGIASLGEDDVMAQEVVGAAGQDYADSLPDFSYDFTADDTSSVTSGGRNLDADLGVGGSEATVTAADLLNDDIASDNITTYGTPGGGGVTLSDDNAKAIDQISSGERTASDLQGANVDLGESVDLSFGSPLPGDNVVADLSGYASYNQQDFLDEAGSGVQLETSYDAFGNAYPTAEQAAQADIDANNAAVIANNPDFVPQYPGDVPEGLISSSADIGPAVEEPSLADRITDFAKYAPIGLLENVGSMATGIGENLRITSPLNTIPGATQQNVGLMSIPIALTNRMMEFSMSPEEKQSRMLSANPNRQGSLLSQGFNTLGSGLTSASQALEDYLNPQTGQGVFVGDTLNDLSVVDTSSGQTLTGADAAQNLANMGSAEGIGDAAIDMAMSANMPLRAMSAIANAGEQLTGLDSSISSLIDEKYVSGELDNNAAFQDALKKQGGDVDKALAAVKNLAYVSGDVPAYMQVGAVGAIDAALPKFAKGIVGAGKEVGQRIVTEGVQGGAESYAAINAVNNALGTDFDPTENIAGAAATEGFAGGVGSATAVAGANALSARQRRNAADEEALMSQPVAAPYGGMDTSGITPGFNQPRSPSSAGSPGTIEGQFTVYDPNLSETAGQPASSTVPSAYDLEGPEAGLAITDQRDPMTTSMETMAAQEVINDQVSQTGAVDFGILQRIQNATGLSMEELGTMVDSATSTRLTPDQIAAIESAPVGDVMTNAPMAPGFDDEVTGNFGGSNISVKPNPDGTTTLTAPSGRISVVEPGQDLDQAIKVFDEIVTPIDVQTNAPSASTSTGGLSSLGLPSGADSAPVVDTSSGTDVITSKMDADNTFEEVSDAQAAANAEAIKAQEVAYTETKAATGSDSAAEAAGEAAYDASIAASSVTETDDGGAEVEIADNLFEAANKADQDVVTVNADGTATVAVDPNAAETGTDVAIVPETTTDVTTEAEGTTDVTVDGTTDLTAAATTDLTVDGDTDTDTDTTAVTVVDDTIDGTATEISGALTDQTEDTSTKKTAVVPGTNILTEVEPPEVEVEEPVVTADPVTADPDVPDIFVPTITTTDENGDTVIECPEGYVQVETEDGPMCQKIITARSSIQRGGRFVRDQGRGYTGGKARLSSGTKGPGQKRKTRTTSRTERVRPTVRT